MIYEYNFYYLSTSKLKLEAHKFAELPVLLHLTHSADKIENITSF